MRWMSLNEVREKYLSFFESKGHLRLPSFPLVPINDKSLLLINSGMAPMKKYFTGEEMPPRRRVTTCQRCIRTPDLERVGKTARHGTYFEMLGNFSFGDYFKHEAIRWAWEFLTECIEIPADLLYPSIYENDEEAFEIWTKEIGVSPEKVIRLGKADNFWEHGSGPCGPCSEIYFDRGIKYGCGKDDCKPGCDCDRFMEIWNNVFSQFNNDGNGNYTELVQKNIDTGMGLERLACVLQGVDNLFEVDTVRKILDKVCEISGKSYGANEDNDVSIRVITDHVRGASFMICDGVIPSNEGRGYVLRRIIRRACRHAKLLGINRAFLCEICDVVIEQNYGAYPELGEKQDYIKKILSLEEERFDATIDAGLNILSTLMADAKENNVTVIGGDDVFKLYDTYGFPIDLTREIIAENGMTVDEEGFALRMDEQKQRARNARANISGWSNESKTIIANLAKTEFVGYTKDQCEAKVIAIIDDDKELDSISEGEFSLVLDTTCFYGEGGGQVGDTGTISTPTATIEVIDTKKTDGVYIHICRVVSGMLSVGDNVSAFIDAARRAAIRRNHSAAHMLQAALREVLGTHVEQAGSYVDETKCRFDFSHYEAVSEEQIVKVEAIVNEHILMGEDITVVETDPDTARKMGAMALFGEKYGSVVRVVKMGDFSMELCAGTHLDNTAKAGLFKIVAESSVAAGVRRIEATTGLGVIDMMREQKQLISETAQKLKVNNTHDIAKRAAQLQDELKAAKRELDALNEKLSLSKLDAMINGAVDVNGIKLITAKIEDSANNARAITDKIKATMPLAVAVVAAINGDKLNFAASCGKDAVSRGANAGMLCKAVSAVCGGNGGGRADSAMSGGRDVSKVDEALGIAQETLASMIK